MNETTAQIDNRPDAAGPRPRRHHRRLTIPGGLLLFACLALPGYRDCGHSVTMISDPLLVALCVFGLVVAAIALAVPPRLRGERWIAIALAVLTTAAMAMLALTWLGRDHAYAGVTIGTVCAASLVAGALVWEREARGRDATARYLLRVLLPLVTVAAVATAALSDWTPQPDKPAGGDIGSIPYLGPT